MAKIIAIINEKGGVGKTATATTLAYLRSKRGHRTALLDFDGQGHSSITASDINRRAPHLLTL